MKNLLVVTQKVDAEDDLLGFFVDWLNEFSKNFDEVDVITLARGHYDLPDNVHVFSLGKEKNNSKITRAFLFYKLLFKLAPKSNGIFAHMSPIFAIASWPAAFLFRKKIILWYLHRSVTLRLKIAERLCHKIVTAAKESLKLKSEKIVETGHGINIDKFTTERVWSGAGKLKILSVGRVSKIKNYETLLGAARIMKDRGINFEIKIVGQSVMPPDIPYFQRLRQIKEELGIADSVNFEGFVSHNNIPQYYKKSDIVVGLTPDGGIDKTILEGMASGCLALTSNNANRKYFGSHGDELTFKFGDESDLSDKITSLGSSPNDYKIELSRFLAGSVLENHDLKNAISRISSLL